MMYTIAHYIYLTSVLFASLCGIYRFKILDAASRMMALLTCSAFINECAASYLAVKYHNNLPLYAIYCFIEFGFFCMYFNKLIDVFIKHNIGLYIGAIGLTLGIINLIFIQHLNSLNTHFLLLEGICVIGMSLFAFFRLLLKNDNLDLFKYPHFWFISILIFFWSTTFLYWGLFEYIDENLKYAIWKINMAELSAAIISYSGIGYIFLRYPKMQHRHE